MKAFKNEFRWLTMLLVFAPAGCTHTEKIAPASQQQGPAPKLITTGSCLELKDRPSEKGQIDLFERKVGELLSQNKIFSATELVERFPDRAHAILTRPANSSPAANTFIQQVHQKQLARPDLYPAIEKLLAQGEKHRLGKQESAWIASWEKAVQLAAAAPVPDPHLWEKISSLQPAKQPWPESLTGSLQNYWTRRGLSHVATTPATAQDLVWFSIGHWHMDRGEPKAALAAFKRAANPASAPLWKEMTELHEAKTLMQLKQAPAAITILDRLAMRDDSPWKRPALAAIGACKFQGGHFQQAEAYLSKAIANLKRGPNGAVEDFAGSSEAESDLGLTLLALGEEARGLALLHANRQRFAISGRVDALLQDLDNEIRYLDAVGRREAARQLREEYDSWQRRSAS